MTEQSAPSLGKENSLHAAVMIVLSIGGRPLDTKQVSQTIRAPAAETRSALQDLVGIGFAKPDGRADADLYSVAGNVLSGGILPNGEAAGAIRLLRFAAETGKYPWKNVTRHPDWSALERLSREGYVESEWNTSIGDEYVARLTPKGHLALEIVSRIEDWLASPAFSAAA